MAIIQSIDHNTFGHWLTGFVDGEGCFRLGNYVCKARGTKRPFADLSIGLRADDRNILERIRAYWGVGGISNSPATHGTRNGKPSSRLNIRNMRALMNVVVPHFDRYPLQTKKRNDYLIWREAIVLFSSIARRSQGSSGYGRLPKWTASELNRFYELIDALKSQRKFKNSGLPQDIPVALPPADRQSFLFDR